MKRGFSLTEMTLVVGIILVLLAISLPLALQSYKRGDETSAIAGLRTLHASQSVFRERNSRCGTLAEMEQAGLLTGKLGTGLKDGYSYRVVLGGDPSQWAAVTWPSEYGVSGDYTYLIGAEGHIARTRDQVVADGTGDAFVTGHAFFNVFNLQALAGWTYLDGGKISDGAEPPAPAPPGEPGGGGGGGGGGGCSLAPPR